MVTGNGRNYVKQRFHPHKVGIDSANVRNYCSNLLEFVNVTKQYFGYVILFLFHVDRLKRTGVIAIIICIFQSFPHLFFQFEISKPSFNPVLW